LLLACYVLALAQVADDAPFVESPHSGDFRRARQVTGDRHQLHLALANAEDPGNLGRLDALCHAR